MVQNMKSISENEMICLKPLNKISNLDFNGSKKSKLVKPKNRRPVESGMLERRSAFAIRCIFYYVQINLFMYVSTRALHDNYVLPKPTPDYVFQDRSATSNQCC